MTNPHIDRPKMFTLTVVFSVLTIAAFCLAGYAFYQQTKTQAHNRTVICQAQHRLSSALISILQLAKTTEENNPHITPDQRDRADQFYHKALELASPLNCKKALRTKS